MASFGEALADEKKNKGKTENTLSTQFGAAQGAAAGSLTGDPISGVLATGIGAESGTAEGRAALKQKLNQTTGNVGESVGLNKGTTNTPAKVATTAGSAGIGASLGALTADPISGLVATGLGAKLSSSEGRKDLSDKAGDIISKVKPILDPLGIFSPTKTVTASTTPITQQTQEASDLQKSFGAVLAEAPRQAPQGAATFVDTSRVPKVVAGARADKAVGPGAVVAGPTVTPIGAMPQVQAGPGVGAIAPQVGSVKTADVAQESSNVNQALDLQRQAALGTAPSAAELTLKQQAEQIIKAQAAQTAGQAYNPAAQRQAAVAGAEAMQQAGAQAATLKAQEMASARTDYATTAANSRQQIASMSMADVSNKIATLSTDAQNQLQAQAQQLQAQGMNQDQAMKAALANQATSLTQRAQDLQASGMTADNALKVSLANMDADVTQRAQDLQASGMNAGNAMQMALADQAAANQTMLANLDAQLKSQGMDDTNRANYLNGIVALQQSKMTAATAKAGLETGAATDSAKLAQQKQGGILSGVSGAAATIFSDERVKKNVKAASRKDINDFVDAIQSYTYDYKDPAMGEGAHLGVLAQDLEKTKFGKQLVKPGPNGVKMVDTAQGFGSMLALIMDQQKRLKKIEGKR